MLNNGMADPIILELHSKIWTKIYKYDSDIEKGMLYCYEFFIHV